MTIQAFAEAYRLKVRLDGCGDPIIPAKLGHLYAHGAGRFGLMLEAPAHDTRLDNTLRARKRTALVAGFTLHPEGACESITLFDPGDPRQAALAIRLVRAKRKRLLSPEQAERARGLLRAAQEALETSHVATQTAG